MSIICLNSLPLQVCHSKTSARDDINHSRKLVHARDDKQEIRLPRSMYKKAHTFKFEDRIESVIRYLFFLSPRLWTERAKMKLLHQEAISQREILTHFLTWQGFEAISLTFVA